MLRFKSDVRVGYFDPRVFVVLHAASLWSLRRVVDVEINSINDPAPGRVPGSLHAYDLALDLDTVGDHPSDLAELVAYLRRVLDPQYDVVPEGDHVHVEWDAHRGPLRNTP
jgi:hypothetical protein